MNFSSSLLTSSISRPALCLLVICFWALNFVAIKTIILELAPQTSLALRFCLASLLFLPFIKWPKKEKLWKIFQISLFLSTIHQGLLFASFAYLSASTIAVLLQSQVLFSVLMGVFFFKEKIGWRMILGLIIGFLGLMVIFGTPQISESPTGFLLILLSAISLAFSYIKMKELHDVDSISYVGLINIFAVPFIVFSSLVFETDHMALFKQANWSIVIPSLLYQVIIINACHALWQQLLAKNPVGSIVPFALLLPILGVAASIVFLKEPLEIELFIGGIITLLGVSIITIRRIKKQTS